MRQLIVFLIILFAIFISAENGNDTLLLQDTLIIDNFLYAKDAPNDDGSMLVIYWNENEQLLNSIMTIIRIDDNNNDTIIATDIPIHKMQISDISIEKGKYYSYFAIINDTINSIVYKTNRTEPIKGIAQWFNTSRTNSFIATIIISLIFLWYIQSAKKGKELYIRKISGLDAVEEAVGRSTEMGKPIMYILGIGYVTDIPTIAGLTILGRVAKKAAEYDTQVLVPCYDPVVMTTAQEVVKESFTEAGRPDTYKRDNIMYITQDQFGYAAGVDGMMMREKPGAIFLQGLFFAESLILAETGYSIGAIQIAGTTETAQLPFFVAACDYTLIGEEMMAASAYMDRNPLMLGSLVGEDLIKFIIIIILTIGLILGLLGPGFNIGIFERMFDILKSII